MNYQDYSNLIGHSNSLDNQNDAILAFGSLFNLKFCILLPLVIG